MQKYKSNYVHMYNMGVCVWFLGVVIMCLKKHT